MSNKSDVWKDALPSKKGQMGKIETIAEVTSSRAFERICSAVESEIQEVYLENDVPWVICFSGGKDSTATLQLIFYALSHLPQEKLTKELHVLSNDTLVENPLIVKHVDEQLTRIEKHGKEDLYGHSPELFSTVRVKPRLNDTFWVNLIGKGYPSPNRWFRWCTQRLKISPTSAYIQQFGVQKQVIIVLGTRKSESPNRAMSMNNHAGDGRLHHHTLSNALVYTPIAELSNNEVWAYLLQTENPWGSDNLDLLGLYSSACDKGECPFVIETGTQSCGRSRFGCWVCTVVERDRSMEHFVGNGGAWMSELLSFRNWLYDIRQQTNQQVPKEIESKVKFGAFLLKTRELILSKLLELQKPLPIQLIAADELSLVQRLLHQESAARCGPGLKEFEFALASGRRIAAIADFNILQTSRNRLGPFFLRGATLTRTRPVPSRYSDSTRLMYYDIETERKGSHG